MAMNGNIMAGEIVAAINTLAEVDKRNQVKVMEKMCGAIVLHIQTNGVITTATTGTGLGACAGTFIHAAGATQVNVTGVGAGNIA